MGCHSALDAESRFSFFWIPAFAGMTIFYAPMKSIKKLFAIGEAGRLKQTDWFPTKLYVLQICSFLFWSSKYSFPFDKYT